MFRISSGYPSYYACVLAALALVSYPALADPTPVSQVLKLPLAFEPNRGQGPALDQYFARGLGYFIALGPARASINARSRSGEQESIAIRFRGASSQVRAIAEKRLPGNVNYFIGRDRSHWRTDIPTYSQVRYPGIYPGIDLLYYGRQERLEFDFLVSPAADPSAIRMLIRSPERPYIDSNGDLVIGAMRQHKPLAYQLTSVGARQTVACQYALRAGNEIALKLGDYDRQRPLVIDPVISYSTFLGGSNNDGVSSVKVDASGNLYVAGFTNSTNFPAQGGAMNSGKGSSSPLLQAQFGDAFVAKLNPAGTALLYSSYLGGSGDDFAAGLAIDPSGSAYVVGSTQSSDFPVTANALQRVYQGFPDSDNNGYYNPGDGFVVKLNAAGNALAYSTYLGGTLNDLALGVAVDSNGDAVVVGTTESHDLPTTTNALRATFQGASGGGSIVAGDGFVSVINPTGTSLVFSTYLGGSGHDAARGVAVDSQNNIYVCGLTSSGDFPVTTGAFQTSFQNLGATDSFGSATTHGFVAKISSQRALVYSTLLGGESSDGAGAIAVDGGGAAYVTGSTRSTKFPTTTNAPQTTYGGRGAAGSFGDIYYGDAFVTKLSADGSSLVYSTYLGGSGDDAGSDIALDSAGDAFVTGLTISSNFPVTSDALQHTFGGFGGQGMPPNNDQGFPTERVRNSGDAFLAKISAAGTLAYSSYFGGSQDDAGLGIAVDSSGSAYIGGSTLSSGLKTSAGALQAGYGGTGTQFPRGDGFVAKFDFGTSVAGTPASIKVLDGFTSTGVAGATLPAPFAVQVLNAQGTAVPGATVNFTATGASINPVSATTDSQGKASTTVTLGSTAGAGKVMASVGTLSASVNLTINSGITPPVVKAILNGASFLNTISPGSWITVYIDQTAAAAAVASNVPFPALLGGVRILVNGSEVPVQAVEPQSPGTQVNALLPYEIPVATAQVVAELNGVQSAPVSFTVQQSGPGIFVFGDNHAVAQNVQPDSTLVLNTPTTPVPGGDYIVVYLTGQGPLDNPVATNALAGGDPLSRPTLAYSATIGNEPVNVTFLGMTPGQVSLAQSNIQTPKDLKPGDYPLIITIGTATSNGPMISITTPRQ